MKNPLYIVPFFKSKKQFITVMAQICHFSQENVGDPQAYPSKPDELSPYMVNTSYQIACFLAQNTVNGSGGVESDIILDLLCEMPFKSVAYWEGAIGQLVKDCGGFR
jgi:hypothetical protein